jgi:hypothetical protein
LSAIGLRTFVEGSYFLGDLFWSFELR